jgi:hypothetical protein
MNKKQLIEEILQKLKAGDCYISGDLVFSLAFRTEKELKQIAQELYIRIDRS